MILSVGLSALTLQISFADNGYTINSPLVEPEPFYSLDSGNLYLRFYGVFQYENDPANGSECILVEYNLYWDGLPSDLQIRLPNVNDMAVRASYEVDFNRSTSIYYNVSTGNIISSGPFANHTSGSNPITMYVAGGNFPRNTAVSGYLITPSEVDVFNNVNKFMATPFVHWSSKPPKHNIYHSHLSEPISDDINRYFIVDDKLYWLSYRLQGAYALVNDVENTSNVESYTSEGEYIGIVQQSNLNGLLSFGSQTTVDDYEVFPIKIEDNRVFNDSLLYPALYYTSSGLSLNLIIDDIGIAVAIGVNKLYVDYTIYLSSFNLEDGTYISSKYYSGANLITSNFVVESSVTESLSDIKCYGIAFQNIDNLPCNLSDIQFGYDLEFVQWRETMLNMLTQIYNALSGQEVTTASYTQPSWSNELKEAEPSTRVSADEVNSVLGQSFDSVDPDLELKSKMQEWVNLFSIPKLITACVFALAMGTIILTVGKKKSD